ncbi:MAG: putative porin [Dysgonamonadaceae bacterium]|jgi:hypothetical protein|nr:putative porin [Dysgonamonadaceae bacterium]
MSFDRQILCKFVHVKKLLQIIALLFVCSFYAMAQAPRFIFPDSAQVRSGGDSLKSVPTERLRPRDDRRAAGPERGSSTDSLRLDSLMKLPRITTWKIDRRTGERYIVPVDTQLYNYQQSTIPDGQSVAMGFLGPLGSPAYSKLFFERGESDPFTFYDAYSLYHKEPDKQYFYNVRLPYSRLNYQRGGGKLMNEERLNALLTMNFGPRLNVGFNVDYIYSRGFYNSQSTKHIDWTLFGNYLGDRVEAHAFLSTARITNFENGGITDDGFITNPDSIGQSFSTTDIPVKFTRTWNRLKTDQLYLSGRYNLGYYEEAAPNDTTDTERFVPVASIIYTTNYKQQYRRFLSYDTTNVVIDNQVLQRIDQFYKQRTYDTAVNDSTTYSSFKNTFALSMREGFKDWVKFGLTAFLEHEIRNYSMLDTTAANPSRRISHRENAVTVGGILEKQQGEFLKFSLRADLGLLGLNLGEFRATGKVETGFDIAGKRTQLTGEAYIKNLKPKYLEENYHSKYFYWNKNFGDIRRVYVGGKLFIPFTNTTLSAGVENIQNYIYYNRDKDITQEGGNVQVLSARIDQDIRFGIFNWNNQIVYQTSGDEDVIPLPALSAYSNLFLKTKIVNELTLQLGIDAHWHSSYFAQGYEPALLQFYNQREKKIGGYPISTVYANMHLKQTRFFLMLYNVAPTVLKPPRYFSLPGYPVNPFVLKMGVSINLNN